MSSRASAKQSSFTTVVGVTTSILAVTTLTTLFALAHRNNAKKRKKGETLVKWVTCKGVPGVQGPSGDKDIFNFDVRTPTHITLIAPPDMRFADLRGLTLRTYSRYANGFILHATLSDNRTLIAVATEGISPWYSIAENCRIVNNSDVFKPSSDTLQRLTHYLGALVALSIDQSPPLALSSSSHTHEETKSEEKKSHVLDREIPSSSSFSSSSPLFALQEERNRNEEARPIQDGDTSSTRKETKKREDMAHFLVAEMYRTINANPYRMHLDLSPVEPFLPPTHTHTVCDYLCYQNGFLVFATDKNGYLLVAVFYEGKLYYGRRSMTERGDVLPISYTELRSQMPSQYNLDQLSAHFNELLPLYVASPCCTCEHSDIQKSIRRLVSFMSSISYSLPFHPSTSPLPFTWAPSVSSTS